jgi:hypothetical protein
MQFGARKADFNLFPNIKVDLFGIGDAGLRRAINHNWGCPN